MAEDKNSPSVHKVDRLILHQSNLSPSLSSSSHSEVGVEFQPKAKGFGISLGLQRPETSRGRLVRTPNTQVDDAEPPLKNKNDSLEEESHWRIWKQSEKEEEEEKGKRAEREESSLSERKEEVEREKRKTDGEVEEERAQMMREKEDRIRLLQGELRREEEQEERKLREESEERLR